MRGVVAVAPLQFERQAAPTACAWGHCNGYTSAHSGSWSNSIGMRGACEPAQELTCACRRTRLLILSTGPAGVGCEPQFAARTMALFLQGEGLEARLTGCLHRRRAGRSRRSLSRRTLFTPASRSASSFAAASGSRFVKTIRLRGAGACAPLGEKESAMLVRGGISS